MIHVSLTSLLLNKYCNIFEALLIMAFIYMSLQLEASLLALMLIALVLPTPDAPLMVIVFFWDKI